MVAAFARRLAHGYLDSEEDDKAKEHGLKAALSIPIRRKDEGVASPPAYAAQSALTLHAVMVR